MPTETTIETIMSNIAYETGAICNNLPFRAVRIGMETKGLLTNAGDLYVGTGNSEIITVTTEDGVAHTYSIPITTKIPGADWANNANTTWTLKCVVDANGVPTFSWQKDTNN